MKISKVLVLTIFLISVFALAVASQISQAANKVSLEEAKTCNVISYNDIQPVYGTCVYSFNSTNCLNSTGPNTNCLAEQVQQNYTCKTGETQVKKNSTECKPLNKFIVTIDKGSTLDEKEIDFSDWGVCVNSTENDCLIVTCGTLKGGSARNGIFNGCDGGKSCQKFVFCKDSSKVLYKSARSEFSEYDPTFYLSKLSVQGVSP